MHREPSFAEIDAQPAPVQALLGRLAPEWAPEAWSALFGLALLEFPAGGDPVREVLATIGRATKRQTRAGVTALAGGLARHGKPCSSAWVWDSLACAQGREVVALLGEMDALKAREILWRALWAAIRVKPETRGDKE